MTFLIGFLYFFDPILFSCTGHTSVFLTSCPLHAVLNGAVPLLLQAYQGFWRWWGVNTASWNHEARTCARHSATSQRICSVFLNVKLEVGREDKPLPFTSENWLLFLTFFFFQDSQIVIKRFFFYEWDLINHSYIGVLNLAIGKLFIRKGMLQ